MIFHNIFFISVSLDNAVENCELPAYPGSSHYPAAVNYMESIGAVVACGGETLADSPKCFAYDGSSWTSLPDSTQQHCYHSSNLIVDQGWWVAGWLQTDGGGCRSEWTSEVFNGEEWFQGPPHPTGQAPVYSEDFCLVQLNSTHSLYTGGYGTITASWLYDWTEGVWTQSGDLNEGRRDHGCAVLDGQGVIVAGGYKDDNDDVYSVELYDPETGTWTLQPGLPQEISTYRPTLLPWSGRVIALFNNEDEVYQRADDGTWSPLEGVVLPGTFYSYELVTIVPDDFASGCM